MNITPVLGQLSDIAADMAWLKENIGGDSYAGEEFLVSSQIKETLTTAKKAAACCSDGVSKIYLAGGYTTVNVNTFESFDIVSRTWTTLAPIPTATAYLSAEYWNGKVYIFGGGGTVQGVSIYDIATNSWTAGTNCPIQIYDHASCIDTAGNVYISGSNAATKNKIYKYSTTADTWTEMATMADNRYFHSMIFKDDFLYIFGTHVNSNSEKYDIENDTISAINPIITHTKTYNNSHVLNGEIIILGTSTYPSFSRYDEENDAHTSWVKNVGGSSFFYSSTSSTLVNGSFKTGRDYACSCVCDGKIFVFGGDNSGNLNTIEVIKKIK